MTADIFAEWMRRQGRRVLRTASSYWHSHGFGAYQAFPYHWVIRPTEEELAQLLSGNGVLAIRYSSPVTAAEGRVSYHAVYEQPHYDLDSLSPWARKNTRRGLRNCSVGPISFGQLAREGWALQADTLDRQGRRVKLNQTDWAKMCLTAADLPGFEPWGALVRGQLAASVMTFQMQDCCYLLYQQCRREYLPARVNNALGFVVTRTMIMREGVRSILYALHSLDAPASMDEFKFRMGYQAKPVRQRVVFHPFLSPLMNRTTHQLLRLGKSLWPGNATLSKIEGMVRFHQEGKLPAQRQALPEQLRGRAVR